MATRNKQIDRIHERLNDIFTDIQEIAVFDDRSIEKRQCAILNLIEVRRGMEAMGLTHTGGSS